MAKKKRKPTKRRTHNQEFIADFKRLSPEKQILLLRIYALRARLVGLLVLLVAIYFFTQHTV